MKVALTAIARHENKYLKEWIDFYQKMGINHIFLGDNNDTNDTNAQRPWTDMRYLDIENSIKRFRTNTLTNSDNAIVMIHAQNTDSGEPPISRNK